VKQGKVYNLSNLTGDITAGLIVTFLLLPQSIAYATLAGVPLTMGLYAGTFPLLVYAIFGSSKYLSVGPVSVASLLVFTGISELDFSSTIPFVEMVVLLTLLIGIIQLLMGLFKFGTLLEYVSSSVLGGFTSALAVVIIIHQLDSFLGIEVQAQQNILSYTFEIVHRIPQAHWLSTVIGGISFLFLLLMKKISNIAPGPFMLILIAIVIVDYFNLDRNEVEVVGSISQEFQWVSFSLPTWEMIVSFIPLALLISFITFFESYSVAKRLADKERESLYPNQELAGLGFANISGAFLGTIPVAGAISRTAVNYESGAKTKLSMIITAGFMFISIFYIAPLFYYLPKTTLAAIIIYAVMNLIDFKQLKYYWRNNIHQAIVFLVTFFATLLFNIFFGLMIGICMSIIIGFMDRI